MRWVLRKALHKSNTLLLLILLLKTTMIINITFFGVFHLLPLGCGMVCGPIVTPAGHDFCSEGHGCMEHSDCVNLEGGECCACKDGFRPLRDDNAYCQGTIAWRGDALELLKECVKQTVFQEEATSVCSSCASIIQLQQQVQSIRSVYWVLLFCQITSCCCLRDVC